MISIPIAVYNDSFKFQLGLFWHRHKQLYKNANERALAVVIKRNFIHEKFKSYEWDIDMPYQLCNGYCEYQIDGIDWELMPYNIQLGLQSVLERFEDNEVLELLDCDMFHLKERNFDGLKHDILLSDNIYEDWHLKCLSDNANVIGGFTDGKKAYHNGGFVPLVATAKTFRKILDSWKYCHIDIVKQNKAHQNIVWWAGMYSLQVACELNKVKMISINDCYIPPINTIDNKTIAHYSVDTKFIDKKKMAFTDKVIDEYTEAIVSYINTL